MAKSPKQWQAEFDAGTLKDAEVIKATPARLQAAQKAAERLVKEEQKDATAMRKVAGKGGGGNPSKKENPKKRPKRQKPPEVTLGGIY